MAFWGIISIAFPGVAQAAAAATASATATTAAAAAAFAAAAFAEARETAQATAARKKAQEAAAREAAQEAAARKKAQESAAQEAASEKTTRTMASKPLQCRVCNNVFSEEYCPRILPCSHTLCDICIARIISTRQNTCPICRKEFTVSSVEDLLIHRPLLNVAKELSFMHMGYRICCAEPSSPSQEFSHDSRTKRTQKSTRYPNHHRGSKSPVQAFTDTFRENFTRKGIADCQEAEAQVADAIAVSKVMKSKFLENNKKIAGLIKILQKWQLSNENKVSNIDQNTKLFGSLLVATRRDKEKLQDFDAKLEAATDFIFLGAVMEDAGKDYELAMKNIGENSAILQETESGRNDTVEKLVEMTATLRNIAEEIGRSEDASPVNVTANDLQSLCRLVKDDARREIFAVKVFEGRQMAAPVKIMSKNQVYLSHLQEREIPPNSFVIKFESLMETFSPRAFLALGVGGEHLGKVIMTVLDKGNLARNFHHLCAGDEGPSYANSPVLGVLSMGEVGESIQMGEYTFRGKKSRDAVPPTVDWRAETHLNIYKERQLKEGDLVGCAVGGNFLLHPYFISHFNIVIKDDPSSSGCSRFRFGVVEEGLDVLKEAIRRGPNIQRVMIVDCGHIISF